MQELMTAEAFSKARKSLEPYLIAEELGDKRGDTDT